MCDNSQPLSALHTRFQLTQPAACAATEFDGSTYERIFHASTDVCKRARLVCKRMPHMFCASHAHYINYLGQLPVEPQHSERHRVNSLRQARVSIAHHGECSRHKGRSAKDEITSSQQSHSQSQSFRENPWQVPNGNCNRLRTLSRNTAVKTSNRITMNVMAQQASSSADSTGHSKSVEPSMGELLILMGPHTTASNQSTTTTTISSARH